jgi:hypothetical protein
MLVNRSRQLPEPCRVGLFDGFGYQMVLDVPTTVVGLP